MTDYTQQFLDIESAAHDGAFGSNPRPTPTDAQCLAGNYKVGKISIYGLPIAIEQPRHSYRTGTDSKTGKRWATRLAAHYGYFQRTKGADGDPVDCFIGIYPMAEHAYVINQHVGGQFDEHKVMLCCADENDARITYLNSYEKGWQGLHSIVKTSISQLQWWLKNGNLTKPLLPTHLPYDGLETMTKKITWDATQTPRDITLDQVLYEIRRADAGENLVLDAINMADILEGVDEIMVLDALVTPYAKLQRKMEVLQGVMNRAGGSITVLAMQLSDPFKQNGVAQVAAVFELSDGQTVSVFFHNPDVTPGKIVPSDELISWKWLLNKKDITIVVAPERGQDLNVKAVAERIIKLAEKNSAAFQRANSKRAENLAAIESLKAEIPVLEKELSDAQKELELVKFEADNKAIADVENQNKASADFAQAIYQSLIDDYGWQNQGMEGKPLSWVTKTIGGGREGGVINPNGDRRVSAKVQVDKLVAMWGDNPLVSVDIDREADAKANAGKLDTAVNAEDPRYVAPAQIDWSKATALDTDAKIQALGLARIDEIGNENVYIEKDGQPYYMKPPGTEKYSVGEYDFSNEVVFGDSTGKIGDPTSPEGYAKIKGIANMELRYRDVLNSFFQARIAAVWSALKEIGWEGAEKSYDSTKNGFLAKFNFKQVGGGGNIVGYWVEIKDGADIQAEIGDNLTGTPADVAAQIDAVVTSSGTVTKDNYPKKENQVKYSVNILEDEELGLELYVARHNYEEKKSIKFFIKKNGEFTGVRFEDGDIAEQYSGNMDITGIPFSFFAGNPPSDDGIESIINRALASIDNPPKADLPQGDTTTEPDLTEDENLDREDVLSVNQGAFDKFRESHQWMLQKDIAEGEEWVSDYEELMAFEETAFLVEQEAQAYGGKVVFGNFDHTAYNANIFDKASPSESAVLPGSIIGEIADKAGNIVARFRVEENGMLTMYKGASGLDHAADPTMAVSRINAAVAAVFGGEANKVKTEYPHEKAARIEREAEDFGKGKDGFIGAVSGGDLEESLTAEGVVWPAWGLVVYPDGTVQAQFALGGGQYAGGDRMDSPESAYESATNTNAWKSLASPEPAANPAQPHIDTLQSIVDGNSDSEDLDALLDKIDAAAAALEAAGLAEQYDELIGKAATKWASLDQQANG